MTRDQHDHVKRKDINKAKKRLSRLNTNRRIALYRLLGQNQEEILDLVRISNLAGAEGFEPPARSFGWLWISALYINFSLVSQTLASLHRFTFCHSDAFLMLLSPYPNRGQSNVDMRYIKDKRELSSRSYYWVSSVR